MTILVEGTKVSVKLCAKCIKRIKKDVADGERPFLTLAHLAATPEKEEVSQQKVTATVN